MARKGFAARKFRPQSKVARSIKSGGRMSGGVKFGAAGSPGSSLKRRKRKAH